MRDLINRHGRGRFAITLDPRDPMPGQQPYQGIVPLDGDSMADVLQAYMRQSEQLDTRLWLAADDQRQRRPAAAEPAVGRRHDGDGGHRRVGPRGHAGTDDHRATNC